MIHVTFKDGKTALFDEEEILALLVEGLYTHTCTARELLDVLRGFRYVEYRSRRIDSARQIQLSPMEASCP